jgi:aspartyl-tRNA(Asn)/glutamyl-tRNA(Gln) amidotransferase subunit B
MYNHTLLSAIDHVLSVNTNQVLAYKLGNEKAFNSLVGQIMKITDRKENPAQVNEILRQRLNAAKG